MNKRALIKKIVAKLADELETYFRAAQFSRAEATRVEQGANPLILAKIIVLLAFITHFHG